jgi:hypothetical protein
LCRTICSNHGAKSSYSLNQSKSLSKASLVYRLSQYSLVRRASRFSASMMVGFPDVSSSLIDQSTKLSIAPVAIASTDKREKYSQFSHLKDITKYTIMASYSDHRAIVVQAKQFHIGTCFYYQRSPYVLEMQNLTTITSQNQKKFAKEKDKTLEKEEIKT